MYKIIIWEGCDCSGKTTLKERYDRKFGFRDLSVDRMFISGLVYNKVKNRNADLENQIYDDLAKFINVFDPVFVHVKSPDEVVYARFLKRGDDIMTSWQDVKDLISEYDKVFDFISSRTFIIEADGNSKVIDEELERIHGICEERRNTKE